MIRHLYGGAPGRRDFLTECGLMSAPGAQLVTELDRCNCPDCHQSMISRGVCPECGEKTLEWGASPHKKVQVADGRLTMNDVETIFYLGCGHCSATLISQVDPEVVAAALTELGWRP